MMHRVAITGVGIISSIGSNLREVADHLKNGRSGLKSIDTWRKYNLKSLVAGTIDNPDLLRHTSGFDQELLLSMSNGSLFCAVAAQEAIKDSGVTDSALADRRTGCIVGAGISGTDAIYRGAKALYDGKVRRVSPFSALQAMSNSAGAHVARLFSVGGRSYSLNAACATSAHAIGHAFELIRSGSLDLALAGGGEELNPIVAGAFDAMRTATSTRFNEEPTRASRPFDSDRDGFVLAEGAGIVILERMDQAIARGAGIRGEIVGYGATSGSLDMVRPEEDGLSEKACMEAALSDANLDPQAIDYINAHATSTVLGDLAEGRALQTTFPNCPPVSSTKALTGHSLGAAGAQEIIFCLMMFEDDFLAQSVNIDSLDPAFSGLNLIQEPTRKTIATVLSNSFGFGGSNASIIVRRFQERNPREMT